MERLFGFLLLGMVVGIVTVALLAKRKSVTIPLGSTGLLYRNGKFDHVLEPGRHHWFDLGGKMQAVAVPEGAQPLYGHETSVLSKDQFSFRVTLTPIVAVTDARRWFEARPPQPDYRVPGMAESPLVTLEIAGLQPLLSARILAWAAERSLDEFLADPRAGLDAIKDEVESRFPGIVVEELLLTQITLPPEVRKMFTEVERARREGLAALERARAEQASLRALANAARTLQSNPQLAQLRMLQAMETAKGAKTFILGRASDMAGGVTEE